MAQSRILLESGNNELEVLEFVLEGQAFGVNVLKIQAIEQFDPTRLTQIQLCHPSVMGTLLFRGNCLTLVDLAQELNAPATGDDRSVDAAIETVTTGELLQSTPCPVDTDHAEDSKSPQRLVLVMEFNAMKTAFLVDGVNRIHRASWQDIHPLSSFLSTSEIKFTGSLQIEGREILLLDMEKIVADILPGGLNINLVTEDPDHPLADQRAQKRIFLAADSAVISAKVIQELKQGNYAQIEAFANGQECYEALVQLVDQARSEGKPVSHYLAAIISDIEMPQMDGLALCRNIKETLKIKDVPVIMFSSLVNDQVAQKCRIVGADDYICKPQFTKLIELLDHHCISGSSVSV